jgi:multidrug efflux pump subunit AcrB
LRIAAPHALLLILALLVLQFDSFCRPAIILLTIPLVIIGANFGLAAFGAFFDFTAMLGLFSLAGIIINNGIVMIDRIDQARNEGRSAAHGSNDGLHLRRPAPSNSGEILTKLTERELTEIEEYWKIVLGLNED